MMNKYMYDFQVQSCKRQIEDKLLKTILEDYNIKIEEVEIPPKDRKFYLNQKKYRIMYRPVLERVLLRTYVNEFIMEVDRGGEQQIKDVVSDDMS